MSHSKGPWRVGRKVRRTIYSSEATEGSLIGVMDMIEDARLAAAAPELLAAGVRALELMVASGLNTGAGGAIDMLSRAIQKAEGGS